ncbi:MAG TPA: hypothetical protein GX507_04040 [Clostridia bacterium]|nr:hypothetical protein [Clostridia bacterium]
MLKCYRKGYTEFLIAALIAVLGVACSIAPPALAAEAKYTVYYGFSMPDEDYLIPVTVFRPFGPSQVEGVVSALIEGPPSTKGLPVRTLIPKGTRLLGAEIKDGVAYLNFSKEITAANVGSRGDALLVASIVNSVSSIPGVDKVQILVEGAKVETIAGHVYVGEPLGRADELVFKGFKDTKGNWAEGQILAFALRGVLSGYPDGTFKPNSTVTRAEFIKMLCATVGLEPKETSIESFRDVLRGNWAHPWIEAAVKAGLLRVSDYPSGLAPNQPIPRKEMAVLLARGAGLEKEAIKEAGTPLAFTDTVQLPGWLKGYIKVVVDEGLLKGYPNLTFRPSGLLTRAESATVMARLAGMSRPDPGVGRPGPGMPKPPSIYTAFPIKESEITTPFFTAGAARVFEASLGVEMGYYTGKPKDDEEGKADPNAKRRVLKQACVMASEGAPGWGIFAAVIPYEPPWAVGGWKSEYGFVKVYCTDPRDGSELEGVEIPVTVIGQ